jgi:hypothetical protein
MLSTAVLDILKIRVGKLTVPIRLYVFKNESSCCLLSQFSRQFIFKVTTYNKISFTIMDGVQFLKEISSFQ